jgi:hypothetical protein
VWLATHHLTKSLVLEASRANNWDALGNYDHLKVVVMAVLSHLCPGSPGETLDPMWDQARVVLLCGLPLGVSPLMFRRLEGPMY